jgi:hypothetical protein
LQILLLCKQVDFFLKLKELLKQVIAF